MSEEQALGKYEEMALVLKAKADALTVTDIDSANVATSIEKTAKDNVKMLNEHMDEQIKDAHAKHKKLTVLRDRLTSPFKAISQDARRKYNAWAEEEQRKAEEEQRKLDAEARKQAEDLRLKEAETLEQSGKTEQASAILESPVVIPQQAPVREMPKAKGAVTWYAKINNAQELFKAWGNGTAAMPELSDKQLESLVTVLKLNDLARALKGNLSKVLPGVEGCKKNAGC